MKRTGLSRRTPLTRNGELARHTGLISGGSKLKRSPLGRTTQAQKERVEGRACLVCHGHAGDCHPAHLIDRARVSDMLADDERAVVPLCFEHHRAYDSELLDLSPYLEPFWRDSLAWAVEAYGLFPALRRVTNRHWTADE